jgi:lipopolysaccharide transport system ATP-binding protein
VPLLALGAGFQADMSGRDNIFMNAALYGVSAREVEARLDEIVEFAGLEDFMDVPVKRYSSGMYLRLAFSVAINMHPNILLADEVLAVGDLEFQERCLERVKQAGREGMAVLFVSHDMEAIRRLCDQVLWLNAGEIVKIGAPEEITSAYANAAWSHIDTVQKGRRKREAVGEAGRLLFVKLTVNDREAGAVRVSDEAKIVIAFRITEAGVTVRPVVDVKARGALAFRAVAPEQITIETPGVYTAKITMPPHLLTDTVYTLDVTLGILRGEQPLSVVMHNALMFPVYDSDEKQSARGTFTGRIEGVVRPKLDWTIGLGRS